MTKKTPAVRLSVPLLAGYPLRPSASTNGLEKVSGRAATRFFAMVPMSTSGSYGSPVPLPLRCPRREFLAAAGASAVAGAISRAAPPGGGGSETDAANPLAEFVRATDATTRWRRIAAGELGAGRFLAAELVSQTWRGVAWRHQLAIVLPAQPAVERPPLVLWIDGGSTPEGDIQAPAKQLPILATIAEASGLPAAVVRQVPNQPLCDGRREDDLIAHSFEQFLRTGDPTWPLLVPMAKTVSAAVDAATDLMRQEWQVAVDGCVVAGASKRGWTSWLAAAVEPRVRGLVPMVIDMLDLPRHMRLQVESFGGPSEALHDYVSRDLHLRLETPRGEALLAIVDPVRHAAAIAQPKILALGTNDAYWPLESLAVYHERLRGPTWVSYAPNAGHELPPLRVAPLVAALGRHVAGVEPLPEVSWTCAADAGTCTLAADPAPAETLLWTADSDSRDFRAAQWRSQAAEPQSGRHLERVARPATGFRAALLECRYARRPLPIHFSSGPLVVSAAG